MSRVRASLARVIAVRAELALAAAILAGWLLVTTGVARVLWLPLRPAVWPVSLGLLLLSGAGWGPLATIAARGLYALTREEPRRGA